MNRMYCGTRASPQVYACWVYELYQRKRTRDFGMRFPELRFFWLSLIFYALGDTVPDGRRKLSYPQVSLLPVSSWL